MSGRREHAFPLASVPVALAVLLADQVTKSLVLATLAPGGGASRVALLGDWLALEYSENRGTAFGMLRDRPEVVPLAAMMALLAVVAVYAWKRPRSAVVGAAVGLAVGGAIGNMVDRIRLGFVVDFVAVGPWPNFNLADSAITIGVLVLVARALLGEPIARSASTSRLDRLDAK